MENLKGKVALVTGAGRGLGAAICQSLSEAGINIACADIKENLAHETAKQVEKNGVRAMTIGLDVRQWNECNQAVSETAAAFGGIDFIINNAAVDVTVSVEDLTVEDWNRIIDTNLNGAFLLSKAAFSVLREAGGGHIVNIASTASKRCWANAAAYHASKWGLLGFSHALHVEGRPHNIKVTAIVSGGMKTPFLLDRFPDIDLTKLQDPRNVADTIRFILSQPKETVIPEITVLPINESSWP